MQFLTSLLGGSTGLYLNAALALGVVLALIVICLWLLKLVFRASTGVATGRNRRLTVVDSVQLDGKRQLVIVRRDNVEHLILTGGAQDVVVETGFAPQINTAPPRALPTLKRSNGRAQPRLDNPAPAPPPAAGPPAAPVAEPARRLPQPSNEMEPVRASLEKLRDFNRSAPSPRRPGSLRHTGLMRRGRLEPSLVPANTDNSAQPQPDSAKTARTVPFGMAKDRNGQAFEQDGDSDRQREEKR